MVLIRRIRPEHIVTATALAAWALLGVAAPWARIADDGLLSTTIAAWGWGLWFVATIAVLVPSPMSATATRIITPLAVLVAAVAAGPLAMFGAIVAAIVVRSGVFVDHMVQGGAYGDETRFALRTPVPYLAPALIGWLILVGSLIGGTVLLAARNWVAGIPLSLVGVVVAPVLVRRLHRLSRRWLVLVPAGLVIHDHLALAETVMSPRVKIASMRIVDAAGDAADLTGGALGARLAVELRESDKVIVSPITARLLGSSEALHVRTFAVAPRRLGAVRRALNL
jgi:hypothetical protein